MAGYMFKNVLSHRESGDASQEHGRLAVLCSGIVTYAASSVDFRGHTLPRLKAVFVVVKVVVLEVERSTCSRRALNALRIIAAQGVCRSGLYRNKV